MSRLVRLLCAALLAIGCGRAQDTQTRAMQSIDRALGVECAHCHTVDDWKRDDKPEFAFASRMMKMVQGLNTGTLRGVGSVSCWTCHLGKIKPGRMPPASWQDQLKKWPETLKLSDEDAKKPAREVYRNVRSMANAPVGSFAMTMSVFAGALGVACDYCHVADHWDSDDKPAKRTARVIAAPVRRDLDVFREKPPAWHAMLHLPPGAPKPAWTRQPSRRPRMCPAPPR